MGRTIDAWCDKCGEVRRHDVLDAQSCKCTLCGHVETLMTPLADA